MVESCRPCPPENGPLAHSLKTKRRPHLKSSIWANRVSCGPTTGNSTSRFRRPRSQRSAGRIGASSTPRPHSSLAQGPLRAAPGSVLAVFRACFRQPAQVRDRALQGVSRDRAVGGKVDARCDTTHDRHSHVLLANARGPILAFTHEASLHLDQKPAAQEALVTADTGQGATVVTPLGSVLSRCCRFHWTIVAWTGPPARSGRRRSAVSYWSIASGR